MKLSIIFIVFVFSVGVFAQTSSQTKPKSSTDTAKTKLRIRQYDMKTQAHYEGGDVALFTHIAKTLKYTQADKDKKVHGNVLLRFDVDADSTVKEVRLIRDPCADCGKALVEMFQNLKFVPAQTHGGQYIRSNMMLEVPVWAH
jgi:TonB family protein